MTSPLASLRPLVPLLRPSRKLLFLSTAQSLPFAAAWTPFFHRGSSLQWSNTSLFWVSSSNSTIHRVDLVAHPVGVGVPVGFTYVWYLLIHPTMQADGKAGRPPGSKTSPGGRLKGILPRPYRWARPSPLLWHGNEIGRAHV